MRQLLWVVGVVVLSACQGQRETPAPALSLSVRQPVVAGFGRLDVGVEVENVPDDLMTVRVQRGETVVFEREFDTGFYEEFLPFQPDEVGDYTATLEYRRAGSLLLSTSVDFYAFPTFPLTRRIARRCGALTVLTDDATQFDCDGVVIDIDGVVIDGRAVGDSRVVKTEAGAVRWVLRDGKLLAETPLGPSNAVAFSFPKDSMWVAAADFAVSADALALLNGQTLELVEWDGSALAPAPWRISGPLAAMSRNGTRSVVAGLHPWFSSQTPHVFCELRPGPKWSATNCLSMTGFFSRQERDGRVLFQRRQELLLVDAADPAGGEVVGTLEAWDRRRLGRAMTRGAPYDNVFPVSQTWPPEPRADGQFDFGDDSEGARSSSEIAWLTIDNATFWEPLP